MKVNNIVRKMENILGKPSMKIKKHSPEILITVGVIGVIGSTIMACKATTKVKDILDESKNTLEIVKKGIEDGNIEGKEYTKNDGNKDITIIYAQTGLKLAKLYAPSIILGTLSLTSIIASNNILRKRNIALGAAYATIDKSFKEYRERVIERFGEKVDRELKYNIKTVEQKVTEIGEDGKEKKVKKELDVLDSNLTSEYSCYFDESSPLYEKNNDYNLMFLRAQQNYANDVLQSRGHIFLNEVYDSLGLPRTKAGQIVGWTKNGPDGYVNFRINEVYKKTPITEDNSEIKYDPVIVLDFNVEGNVWDKM